MIKNIKIVIFLSMILGCQTQKKLDCEVIETSQSGNKLTPINKFDTTQNKILVSINPEKTYQTILGIGGSFTQATGYLLQNLSKEKRNEILNAYFSNDGAQYSLTRTHIASCDFSLYNYSYSTKENDWELKDFSIKEDYKHLIPIIKEAQSISKEGFNIIASPWTAPPWMKDNNAFVGGKLKKDCYEVYALYFLKYLQAYKNEGINIWGVTPVNEPHGNGNNWESMYFSPKEMTNFVQNYLGPKLEKENFNRVNILGYDQNRAGLKEWVDVMYDNPSSAKYYAGVAVHWYESTYDYFPDALNYAHNKNTSKLIVQTEGCIDAEVPVWQNDAWYWQKNATDWGWDWASEKEKYLHPKYAPVHRYATDLIGCLNNWVNGWIDWNMVLDKQGGPNWFKNWCIAPIIVDTKSNEIYYTPLFYVMTHFSKYIRPHSKKIDCKASSKDIMVTAVINPDKSIAVVVFNHTNEKKTLEIKLEDKIALISINDQALQTIIIKNP